MLAGWLPVVLALLTVPRSSISTGLTSSYTMLMLFCPLRYMLRISKKALYTRSSFWNRI